MARTAINVVPCTRLGVQSATGETTGDTVNQHSLAADERTFLHVRNLDAGASHNVTLRSTWTSDGLTVASDPKIINIPLSGQTFIGPFPNALFQQQADGLVYVDVDSTQLRLRGYTVPIRQ